MPITDNTTTAARIQRAEGLFLQHYPRKADWPCVVHHHPSRVRREGAIPDHATQPTHRVADLRLTLRRTGEVNQDRQQHRLCRQDRLFRQGLAERQEEHLHREPVQGERG